jgi:hypothetical protein
MDKKYILFGLLLVSLFLLLGCTQIGTFIQTQLAQNTSNPQAPSNQSAQETTPAPARVIGGEPNVSGGSKLVDVSGYPEGNDNEKLIKVVLGSYTAGDDSSFNDVNKIADLGPGATDDILPLLQKDNIYAQWSGIYAFSVIIPNADSAQKEKIRQALLPLLGSSWVSIRTTAAYDLLALGEKSAIPVLIDSLNVTERLFLSEPPAPVCETANEALTTYTEKDFGFSCDSTQFDSSAMSQWQNWWNSNNSALSYDAGKQKFVGG